MGKEEDKKELQGGGDIFILFDDGRIWVKWDTKMTGWL